MNARWNVDDVDDGEDIDVDDDGYHDGRSVGDLNAGLSVVALTIVDDDVGVGDVDDESHHDSRG